MAAVALSLSASQLQAETVFSDDFSDGNRDGWYTGSGSSGLAVAGGELVTSGEESQFLVYFPEVSLEVGDTLEISFDMSLSSVADSDRALRMGVFGTNEGSQVSDGFGYSNSAFEDYLGARVYTNAGSAVGAKTRFAERVAGIDSLLAGTGWGSEYGYANGVDLASNESYVVKVLMSRTDATSLETTFSINNVTASGVISSYSSFDFDTFAFYKYASGDVTLDNFKVTSIPEVSRTGMIMGVFATTCLFLRRRSLK
jgi:hypothetical protein